MRLMAEQGIGGEVAENFSHAPVLLGAVLEALLLDVDENVSSEQQVVVDATFGAGGYSRAILEKTNYRVVAIDRDANVIARADALAALYPDRFRFVHACFADMETALTPAEKSQLQAVVMDLGVSSMQLDDPLRGFSFRADGPLDMRMGLGADSAADLVNGLEEEELANIIYEFGEEKKSRRVARAIVAARPITHTLQLAEIVRKAVGHSPKMAIDPATRTFQALRIAANGELAQLENGLAVAGDLLTKGGRLIVVSFHSLEDRMVKNYFKEHQGGHKGSNRHLPVMLTASDGVDLSEFRVVHKKVVIADDNETSSNPRARSARLRAGIKQN
ncbi:MAG: 16S rRNA (cytosine(1402)-N(4))-methyltransferase RsmH [Alphaproteobacteria bacterium]